jgi:hypothetical protein
MFGATFHDDRQLNWLSYQSILTCIILSLTTVFLAIQAIFKTPDKRRNPNGKPWRLPPGPQGWPIIGNMIELRSGSEAVSDL